MPTFTEMQQRLQETKRQIAAMTPEERAAELAKMQAVKWPKPDALEAEADRLRGSHGDWDSER